MEANRQTREAVGEVRPVSAGRPGELHGADAPHQLLQVDPELQTREVHAGSGYLSGHSLVQHFGLGAETRASAVEITWPSGAVERLENSRADRYLEIREP